tara:strand:- start:1281 stop:1718 length:438 start_codon:yes stop_codon:yes gene_type:complete
MISYLNKMMSKKPQVFLLIVLLTIFITLEVQVPLVVAELMDNVLGKIAIIVASLSLLKVHPLVGVLGLVAGYVLIERISTSTGSGPMELYTPSETKKFKQMTALNQFPYTVEEEVIQNMLPMTPPPLIPPEYKPTQESLHSASKV